MEQASPQPVRLIACPHLLSIEKDRIDLSSPAGGTVADHLHAIGWMKRGR